MYHLLFLQTKDEKAILSNQSGSERYVKFLQGLGQLIRLSDCDPNKVYIGGLNKDGSDGQYCYGWQDETMHGKLKHFIKYMYISVQFESKMSTLTS